MGIERFTDKTIEDDEKENNSDNESNTTSIFDELEYDNTLTSYNYEEQDIVNLVVDILDSLYPNQPIETEVPISRVSSEIIEGEISNAFIPDILVHSESIAIECKGSYNHSLGIGQALMYNHHGYTSYLAAYDVNIDIKNIIRGQSIGLLNITDNDIEVIKCSTKETDVNTINNKIVEQLNSFHSEFISLQSDNSNSMFIKIDDTHRDVLLAELDSYHEEISQLVKNRNSFYTELEELRDERRVLKNELHGYQGKVEQLKHQKRELRNDIKRMKSQKREILDEEIEDNVVDKAAKYELLKTRIPEGILDDIEPDKVLSPESLL